MRKRALCTFVLLAQLSLSTTALVLAVVTVPRSAVSTQHDIMPYQGPSEVPQDAARLAHIGKIAARVLEAVRRRIPTAFDAFDQHESVDLYGQKELVLLVQFASEADSVELVEYIAGLLPWTFSNPRWPDFEVNGKARKVAEIQQCSFR